MDLLLLVPELLSIGGMQRYYRLLVAALDRYVSERATRLSVLSLNDPPPARLPAELSGLGPTRLQCFERKRSAFVGCSVTEAWASRAIIYGHVAFAPLALLHRRGRPSSRRALVLHGVEAWHRRSRLHAWGIGRMDAFISVSQYTLDMFRQAYSLPCRRDDIVVPNPVSPELLSMDERRPPASDGPPRLLTATRLAAGHDEPKGVDVVIRSLPALLCRFPDLVYEVIGDGGDRPRLEALARGLGVQHAVRFLGFVSEETLKQRFAACTLYVMPSTKEGFGFVFIEAMAYGKPVVAARATAVPEVVDHGETGLLIEPGDVQQLGESISLLLRDAVLRDSMGRAARQAVERRFTYQKFQERWFSVCDSLIRPRRA
jgi:glycosyltransferase involved in cell wall biosynthesis